MEKHFTENNESLWVWTPFKGWTQICTVIPGRQQINSRPCWGFLPPHTGRGFVLPNSSAVCAASDPLFSSVQSLLCCSCCNNVVFALQLFTRSNTLLTSTEETNTSRWVWATAAAAPSLAWVTVGDASLSSATHTHRDGILTFNHPQSSWKRPRCGHQTVFYHLVSVSQSSELRPESGAPSCVSSVWRRSFVTNIRSDIYYLRSYKTWYFTITLSISHPFIIIKLSLTQSQAKIPQILWQTLSILDMFVVVNYCNIFDY